MRYLLKGGGYGRSRLVYMAMLLGRYLEEIGDGQHVGQIKICEVNYRR